jgi:hypothetical protein
MATVSVAGSIGSNPLIPSTVISGAGTLTYNLTGLHALGAVNSPQGLVIVINISAFSAGTLTVSLYGVSSSGFLYGSNANGYLAQTTALGATGVKMLSVAPGLGSVSNQDFNGVVPNTVQVQAVSATSPSFTFAVDYVLGV